MRTLIIIVNLFVTINCLGQLPYFDVPGMVTRSSERKAAKDAYNETIKTTVAYGKTMLTSETEKNSKTRLNFNTNSTAYINYLEYSNVCNNYFNPFKKQRCLNRYNYLKQAHMQILELIQVSTSSKINQGVKELIGEKYTSITNTILNELEQMKNKAEEGMFSTFLKTKK